MLKATVTDRDGNPVGPWDTVTNFRGEKDVFLSVAALPAPGKSAKVTTERGTFYATVFDLTVTPEAPDLAESATRFAELIAGMEGMEDTFESFSCHEIEALADICRAVGNDHAAEVAIAGHARGDEQDDAHYLGE